MAHLAVWGGQVAAVAVSVEAGAAALGALVRMGALAAEEEEVRRVAWEGHVVEGVAQSCNPTDGHTSTAPC